MIPNVSLTSLEFGTTNTFHLGSIKANLSNGVSSECFKKENLITNQINKTSEIQFDQNIPIKEVGALVWKTGQFWKIKKIKFFDSEEILQYEYSADEN